MSAHSNTDVSPGAKTLSVHGPASCFIPAPRTVSVVAGGTAAADYALTCRPIVYSRHVSPAFEIFTIQPDGSGQTNLTDDDDGNSFDPAWSPNTARAAGGLKFEVTPADQSNDQPHW